MFRSSPILLGDDDQHLLNILTLAAKMSIPGAIFTQVYSYEQASTYLHNLEAHKFKLMLVDIDLGGLRTGLDLLVHLSSLPLCPCLIRLVDS